MSDDVKKVCAREALKWIKSGTVIGLGGGSTISYLIQYIKEDADLRVKVVTPSVKTRLLCIEQGLEVLYTSAVDQISVAFDGCDEVDESLNALKSGGGIHTKEKLIASMAEDYILLVDETKVVDRLTFKHPVVLEILEDSLAYVQKKVAALGGKPVIRTSGAKDGFTLTENGNLLLDVYFEQVEDITGLESELQQIRGVVDTSLFVHVATKALIAGEDGIRLVSSKQD
ncbi:ribose 5-phosphate isomerase A [Paenibacillus rhizophilus]|uniref:Ribose 5-phosphate isomerase A n=1 Tax=Paenibacillus rhizophilus TaxID=1850366 RepID=A0A3N9PA18_9BACL|nr:ribose 5-phosphate isomerase A [Paenibacillus rhizophilus]RQW13051.1 ribose 5-phosphate isomerase A [Paenibacillus rhizophilus]